MLVTETISQRITAKVTAILAATLCLAIALFPTQAAAKGDTALTYKVRNGDTLYSLADRYFIGRNVTAQVAKLNKIADPNLISIGKTLYLPRRLLRYNLINLTVYSVKGRTVIEGRAATSGSSLREGDHIQTKANSFITFQGKRGARVSLPSNTSAELMRAREYVLGNTLDVDFRITNGRGEVVAPKLRKQERFQIRTPLAVTAVRGTEYRVAHDEGLQTSWAEVTEGAVAVEAGGGAELAKGGFGVPMTDAGVGDLESLLAAPELANPALVQSNETLSFDFVPTASAEMYRTQIAEDAGFLEVIAEGTSNTANAEFASIPDGTYFVRSRGVSVTGVEGLGEATAFKRKRLGVTANAEPSALEDGLKFSWMAQGTGDSSFSFQLWDAKTPDTPIIDEVGVQDGGFIVTGLEPGTYMWRVAATAVDEDGLLKVWSTAQKLNVAR